MTCAGTPDDQYDDGVLSKRNVMGGLASGVGAAAAVALVTGCDSKGANQAGGDGPPREATGSSVDFGGQAYATVGHPTEEPVGGQPPPVPSALGSENNTISDARQHYLGCPTAGKDDYRGPQR